MNSALSRFVAFGSSILVGCSAPMVGSMEHQNCAMSVDLLGDYVGEAEKILAMTREQIRLAYPPQKVREFKHGLLSVTNLLVQNCERISEDDPVIGPKIMEYKARARRVQAAAEARAEEERARGEKPIEIF